MPTNTQYILNREPILMSLAQTTLDRVEATQAVCPSLVLGSLSHGFVDLIKPEPPYRPEVDNAPQWKEPVFDHLNQTDGMLALIHEPPINAKALAHELEVRDRKCSQTTTVKYGPAKRPERAEAGLDMF